MQQSFNPFPVYAPAEGSETKLPRVFIAPQRYVQGEGVLEQTGQYLQLLRVKRCGVLASKRGMNSQVTQLTPGLVKAGVEMVQGIFGGECSLSEIELHAHNFKASKVDCIVAVGGGKCVDAGKAIAWRLAVPVVVVPTLASNDAPCSALSIIYTDAGETQGPEWYADGPALVVMDTAVVASASERYLVAGMGDAMATWYEARVCLDNPLGITTIGARPTLAACALGEICAHTLFEDGIAAAQAVLNNTVDTSLDKVVEANTLLSGLGFESGGIAAAHSIAQGYPSIERVHANYLHGEMVAMGLIAQLVMDSKNDEARKVATFFARVGLPIHLGQLSLDPEDNKDLDAVAEVATAFPFMSNMPLDVTQEVVRTAIADAHKLGVHVFANEGDKAYQRLHTV